MTGPCSAEDVQTRIPSIRALLRTVAASEYIRSRCQSPATWVGNMLARGDADAAQQINNSLFSTGAPPPSIRVGPDQMTIDFDMLPTLSQCQRPCLCIERVADQAVGVTCHAVFNTHLQSEAPAVVLDRAFALPTPFACVQAVSLPLMHAAKLSPVCKRGRQ
eukprot:5086400-Prymnesium_polylepis.1